MDESSWESLYDIINHIENCKIAINTYQSGQQYCRHSYHIYR